MPLINLQDKIRRSQWSQYSSGVLIDIAKAFDTVDHRPLMKLEMSSDLFQNYLSNRHQYISCNGYNSKTKLICFGVPQGSILDPLLFLILLNDSPRAAPYWNFFMNRQLNSVNDWFLANRLSLNSTKANYILFRTNRKNLILIRSCRLII